MEKTENRGGFIICKDQGLLSEIRHDDTPQILARAFTSMPPHFEQPSQKFPPLPDAPVGLDESDGHLLDSGCTTAYEDPAATAKTIRDSLI